MKNEVEGKRFAFTGTLNTMNRHEAEDRVVNLHGIVQQFVSGNTDYLVTGNYQLSLFEPELVTRKRKMADQLLAQGSDLKIINEDIFLEMIKL